MTHNQETLTRLLEPSDEVLNNAARLFERLIEWKSDPHNAKLNMLAAYRYILEQTVHDMGLVFQSENLEMEYGYGEKL